MLRISQLTAAVFFSGLALPAQTGSYTTFGSGCASSVSRCPSSNPNVKRARASAHNSNIFANPVVANAPLVVLGFRYYNRALATTPVKVTTKIYRADASGKPKNPAVATSVMLVTSKLNWHRTRFTRPLIFKKGETFFISHEGGPAVTWSWDVLGSKAVHYWHGPTSTSWRGPFKTQNWAWRVDCAGGKSITSLSNSGVPKINGSFSVDLSGALPSTVGLLAFGASKTKFLGLNLPLDLKIVGATGCFLNMSMDASMTAPVDAQGKAQVKLGLPNDPKLLGIRFHNQFLVLDKAANPFGFSFSNGGTGVIGR